jgi:hypothetical protein
MSSFSSIECEIRLNRIASGYELLESGNDWFVDLDEMSRRAAIRTLGYMTMQAGATADDVVAAITSSKLKPTFTPCVQLSRGKLKTQISKVSQLPNDELPKVFRLLIELLRIADRRRKDVCDGECSHWWHQDLKDEEFLDDVKKRYMSGEL